MSKEVDINLLYITYFYLDLCPVLLVADYMYLY